MPKTIQNTWGNYVNNLRTRSWSVVDERPQNTSQMIYNPLVAVQNSLLLPFYTRLSEQTFPQHLFASHLWKIPTIPQFPQHLLIELQNKN